MLTNDTEYEEGLRFFEVSFNRTRNVDTPMELEVIRTTSEQFQQLGWRAKILYALKSLRYGRPAPLHRDDSNNLMQFDCVRPHLKVHAVLKCSCVHGSL